MAAVGHHTAHLVTAAQLLVLESHTPDTLHRFMFCHPTLDEILRAAITARKIPFEG
jgi:dihydrolipoamide dehydrogenase